LDAEPLDPGPLRAFGLDVHVLEAPDRARREAVTADFLARELGLVYDEHLAPGAREPVRGGRPAGAAADDDDVAGGGFKREVLDLRGGTPVPRPRLFVCAGQGPASRLVNAFTN